MLELDIIAVRNRGLQVLDFTHSLSCLDGAGTGYWEVRHSSDRVEIAGAVLHVASDFSSDRAAELAAALKRFLWSFGISRIGL